MRILPALTRYGETGEGDVKRLTAKGCAGCVLANGACSSIPTRPARRGFTVSITGGKPTESGCVPPFLRLGPWQGNRRAWVRGSTLNDQGGGIA